MKKKLLNSVLFAFCFSAVNAQIYKWSIGSGGNDLGFDITLDGDGNVNTTGYFYAASVDFDPGAGVVNLPHNGIQDCFIQKLSDDNEPLWGTSFGGSFDDESKSIFVEDEGTFYLTRLFESSTYDANFEGPEEIVSNNGGADVFTYKIQNRKSICRYQ